MIVEGQRPSGHLAAGFVAGAGAVDEEVLVLGKVAEALARSPLDGTRLSAGNHLGLGEQIEGLANVKSKTSCLLDISAYRSSGSML